MTNDRLMWLLANWADWMKAPSHKLGYPSKSAFLQSGGGSSNEAFEIMCDQSDERSAKAIDAIIYDLSRPHIVAIEHVWLGHAFSWPTQELDYVVAIESIAFKAEKKGIV